MRCKILIFSRILKREITIKNGSSRLIAQCLIATALLLSSFTASAVVSFSNIAVVTYSNIVDVGELGGRSAGPFLGPDIYWQGGANDVNLVDLPCCNAMTPGLNTVGSTAIANSFIDSGPNAGDFFSQGYQVGNIVYGVPLVFGSNVVGGQMTQSEFLFIADGLQPEVTTLSTVAPSIVTLNPNGTAQATFYTEDPNFTTVSEAIGYFLSEGQTPEMVFTDTSLFFGDTDFQQGVIDQFNYYLDEVVDPSWTSLAFYLSEFTSTATPDSIFPDLILYGGAVNSYVSFDEGAIPQEVTSVPEPSTYMLLGIGMLGLIGFSRKKVRIS